jgi:hypothetical protein
MQSLPLLTLTASLLLFAASASTADPTEKRPWKSTAGTSITAQATGITNNQVSLTTTDGRTLSVPLDKLAVEDRTFLLKHFQIEPAPAPAPPASGNNPSTSTATPASGLAHPLSQTIGPITTSKNSQYLVYLPSSLKADRDAPLLFFTSAGGGNPKAIDLMTQGAEVNGWIVATSIESSNKLGFEENHRHTKNCLDHLFDTLPIDKDRVYFTGGSGGGATAFYNAGRINHAGAIPMIGYIPDGTTVSGGNYFVINGATDYNRYTSAHARKQFGSNAIHRFNPRGHSKGPDWLIAEGMTWLNGRYLSGNSKELAGERLDFETSLINWIKQLQTNNEPWRAYDWALFLKDEYDISGPNEATVEQLVTQLAADPINHKYVEGLAELDEFSRSNLADHGTGSLMDHTTSGIQRAAEKLAADYAGVPHIEEVAQALAQPTVSNKK